MPITDSESLRQKWPKAKIDAARNEIISAETVLKRSHDEKIESDRQYPLKNKQSKSAEENTTFN